MSEMSEFQRRLYELGKRRLPMAPDEPLPEPGERDQGAEDPDTESDDSPPAE